MTCADSSQDELNLAESLTRQAESVELINPDYSVTTCSFYLNRVVEQIRAPEVRKIVSRVFTDLLRLLEDIRPLERRLQLVEQAEETLALLQFIHEEASALVKFIKEDALECEALSDELCDTLDAITFAVSHDLQRVFESRRPTTSEEEPVRVVVGKLLRAYDVLTNCLQQATISLAIKFDPELVGTNLFNNWDMRHQQSVKLCEDLSNLLKLVESCEQTRAEPTFADLIETIEEFRNQSMECLRYADWPEFESFCERIQFSETPSELEPVLHQFRCYLETLLGQVKMRAVLANEFCIEFGDNDIQQSPSPSPYASQLYSSIDLEDDNVAWDPFVSAA
jgi:hypothetical protein